MAEHWRITSKPAKDTEVSPPAQVLRRTTYNTRESTFGSEQFGSRKSSDDVRSSLGEDCDNSILNAVGFLLQVTTYCLAWLQA